MAKTQLTCFENNDLPVRLVSRLTTELALMNLRGSLRFVSGRYETSMIAQALLRGAVPHLVQRGAIVLPGNQPLIGSISAVARSFGVSVETVRRHVHVLARQGMFIVASDGVRLAPSPEAGARIRALLHSVHDGLIWLLGQLYDWGIIRHRPGQGAGSASLDVILRTALDIRFLGYEKFHAQVGGWTTLALWNALSAASVRHITTNQVLSRQFASRSTPDDLRRPIALRTLCVVTSLPYATVWRHMAALETAQRVVRTEKGYVVLTGQLLTPQIEQNLRVYVLDILNRVERLVTEGLNTDTIPSMFMGPMPELVPIP